MDRPAEMAERRARGRTRKIAGILAEATATRSWPGSGSTSLSPGPSCRCPPRPRCSWRTPACLDRERLLAAILTELASRYRRGRPGPDPRWPARGVPPLVRHGRAGGPGGAARRGGAGRHGHRRGRGGRLEVRHRRRARAGRRGRRRARPGTVPPRRQQLPRPRTPFRATMCAMSMEGRAPPGRAERADAAPALEDPAAARPAPLSSLIAAAVALLILIPPGRTQARAGSRSGWSPLLAVAWLRCPVPALADHHLRAHHPPPPAARGHPVPVGPGLPADQDQRRLVLARADRPPARLRPARGRIRGRARPAGPRPRSREVEKVQATLFQLVEDEQPRLAREEPEPDRPPVPCG